MLRALPALAVVAAAALTAPQAAAESPAQWCASARSQVLEWSLTEAAQNRSKPHVTTIRKSRTVVDRVIESPADGIVLRCVGRAKLSNGYRTTVTYGFRSIDGNWYLFLKRAR